MENKEISSHAESLSNSIYWKEVLKPFIEDGASAERLRGANKDNFEKIQAETNACRTILDKVEEDVGLKFEK